MTRWKCVAFSLLALADRGRRYLLLVAGLKSPGLEFGVPLHCSNDYWHLRVWQSYEALPVFEDSIR